MSTSPWSRRWLAIEWLLIVPIFASIAYTIWFYFKFHYLPQPFFYEPSGTWMDWYSLTRWAIFPGAYDVEQTIYPPLTFVVMKVFMLPGCYLPTDALDVRNCDWLGGAALTVMWVIDVVLTIVVYRRIDRTTAWPRALAMTFGFPMLYAFERGNLLIFCYACALLGFGPLLRSARLRWLFAGLAVNFKVYLISAILAPLLRRRWVAVEGMVIATAVIYGATWYVLGEGSPVELIRNITNYSAIYNAAAVLDLWFPSSYHPVETLLTGTFPLYTVLSSSQADAFLLGVQAFTRVFQAMLLLAAGAAWLRPEVVPPHRLVFLAVALALGSSEAGGYTQILTLVFVFMEKRRGFGRTGAILLAYLLSIPADVTIGSVPPLVRYSWMADVDVIAEYGVGIMSLLRPGLSMILAMLLAGVTIHDVWSDIRVQGWRTRWRFRRDLPLLVGAGEAMPPR